MKSCTYFSLRGFSINEGGRFFNIHMSWKDLEYKFFIYVFVYRWSWFYMWK